MDDGRGGERQRRSEEVKDMCISVFIPTYLFWILGMFMFFFSR